MPDMWVDLRLSWSPGENDLYCSLQGGRALTRSREFTDERFRQLCHRFAMCVRQPEDRQLFRGLYDRLFELIPEELRAALLRCAREPEPAALRLTLTPALQNLPWECTPLDRGAAADFSWGTGLRAVRFAGSTPHSGVHEQYWLFFDEELGDDPLPAGIPPIPPPQVTSLLAQDAPARLRMAMWGAGVLHLLAHGERVQDGAHRCTEILRGDGGALIGAGDIADGALFAELRAPVVLADCCYSAWQDPGGGPSLAGRVVANGRAKLFLGNLDEARPGKHGSAFFTAFIGRLYAGDSVADCLLAARRGAGEGPAGIMNYVAVCHVAQGVGPADTVYGLLGIPAPGARRRRKLWKLPLCAAVAVGAAFAARFALSALVYRQLPPALTLLLGAGLGAAAGAGWLAYDRYVGR